MFLFYLRFMPIPIVLLTAILFVIHAQPHKNPELRERLLVEDCVQSCFMGIYPRQTTIDEAVHLLQSNDWVKELKPFDICAGSPLPCDAQAYLMSWTDKAPSWLNRSIPSDILSYDSGIVTALNLVTTDKLQLFDIYQAGFGDLGIVLKSVAVDRYSSTMDDMMDAIELLTYPQEFGFTARSYGSICRHNIVDFLALPVSDITIGQIIVGFPYSDENFDSLGAVIKSKYCQP